MYFANKIFTRFPLQNLVFATANLGTT